MSAKSSPSSAASIKGQKHSMLFVQLSNSSKEIILGLIPVSLEINAEILLSEPSKEQFDILNISLGLAGALWASRIS